MKQSLFFVAAVILISSSATLLSAQTPANTHSDSALLGLREPSVITNRSTAAGVPDEAVDLNNTGVRKAIAGDYEGAVRDLQAALKIAPSFSRASVNLGLAYGYLHQYALAITIVKDLTVSSPDFADGHAVLGELQLKSGSIDEAIANLKRGLSLDAKDHYGLTNLGSCYFEKKMYREAIEAFDEAIKVNARFVVPYNNKGTALVKLGKYKEAVSAFSEAIAIDKNTGEAYNNLGVALDHLGKKKEAHQAYVEAVRLRPTWDYALYNLALSYIEQGNKEEATRQMNALAALDSKLADKVKDQLWARYVVNASKIN